MAASFDLQATRVQVLNTAEFSVELGESLAVGGYSQVFRAKLVSSSKQEEQKVAAKKVQSAALQDAEVCALKQLHHKNVIKFHGLFRCENETYIIMELAENGDLFHFLLRYRLYQKSKNLPPRLPIQIVWKWVFEAACALAYLHSKCQNHRDVKSLNFLVMGDYVLKLGDMGLVKHMEQTQDTRRRRGTCQWMAPEVIRDQIRSMKSDVFSFSIVVWEIFTTDVPYRDRKGDFHIMQAVIKGDRPTIPQDCPPELALLMQRCWNEDYKERPDMSTVCEEVVQYQTEVDGSPDVPPEFPNDVHMDSVNPSSSGTKLPSKDADLYPSFGSVLTDVYLLELAQKLGQEWKQLGIYLQFGIEEIYHIENDNRGSTVNAIVTMLIQWRKGQNPEHGLKQVVENLSQALASCKRQDLAYKVQQKLQEYASK